MKKYERLFETKEDYFLFPMLIRSMKETGFKPDMRIDKLIEKCLRSRNEHISEPFYVNVSFWPKDLEIYANSFSALFIARVVNMDSFGAGYLNNQFISNFLQYVGGFKTIHESAFCEIYLALIKLKGIMKSSSEKIDAAIRCFEKTYDLKRYENLITPYKIC
jgi:hypothetical protein